MDKNSIRDYELDIIVKAWRDDEFRSKLLREPKKAIEEEFQITLPKALNISVHEENELSIHLIVPSLPNDFESDSFSDEELKDVIGGVLSTGHFGSAGSLLDKKRIDSLKKELEKQHEIIRDLKDKLKQK